MYVVGKYIHSRQSQFSFILLLSFAIKHIFICVFLLPLSLCHFAKINMKLVGSHGTLLGVINAFVHVIMYSYYFLTSYRPELRDSLWWKKHITQIQLVSGRSAHRNSFISKHTVTTSLGETCHKIENDVMLSLLNLQIQFGILVVHFLNPIFFFECGWPKTLSIIGVIQNLFMFILFLDFYIKAYVKKSKD